MAILWTPDLTVGVEIIDQQHQELYRKINELLEACNQGKGRVVVSQTLEFLAEYVVTHFANEEGYMQQFTYPDFQSHQMEHKKCIENLKQLKQLLADHGPNVELIIKTNALIVDWLNRHIRNTDLRLAAFLKDKL